MADEVRAYHGSHAIEAILREGLIAMKAHGCKHVWLAKHPEDALAFGPVVEVDMTGLDFGWIDEDEPAYWPVWQGCYHGGDIEPSRIKLLAKEGHQ